MTFLAMNGRLPGCLSGRQGPWSRRIGVARVSGQVRPDGDTVLWATGPEPVTLQRVTFGTVGPPVVMVVSRQWRVRPRG